MSADSAWTAWSSWQLVRLHSFLGVMQGSEQTFFEDFGLQKALIDKSYDSLSELFRQVPIRRLRCAPEDVTGDAVLEVYRDAGPTPGTSGIVVRVRSPVSDFVPKLLAEVETELLSRQATPKTPTCVFSSIDAAVGLKSFWQLLNDALSGAALPQGAIDWTPPQVAPEDGCIVVRWGDGSSDRWPLGGGAGDIIDAAIRRPLLSAAFYVAAQIQKGVPGLESSPLVALIVPLTLSHDRKRGDKAQLRVPHSFWDEALLLPPADAAWAASLRTLRESFDPIRGRVEREEADAETGLPLTYLTAFNGLVRRL